MTAVHQLVPSFAPRNAIGNHTLQVQRVLRELGLESDIYVADAWREIAHLTKHYRELPTRPDTWLLYQSSTGSPMADWLVQRAERKLVNYHNITPAELFAPWEPHVAVELIAGRRQLAALAARTELAVADSAYNEVELREVGYRNTTVVPILLDTASFEREIDQSTVDRLRSQSAGGTSWLFVGRLSPNKAQHDLIKALAVHRRVYDPKARLRLVGGPSSHAYLVALQQLAEAAGVADAVDFAGDISDAELAAHYRAADVFVCTSDHEGFCIPLLEAMHHDVPVVAYASSAVPETLGNGGLCLPDKTPTRVAAAVDRVTSDANLRGALTQAGRRRLADFDLEVSRRKLAHAIRSVVAA